MPSRSSQPSKIMSISATDGERDLPQISGSSFSRLIIVIAAAFLGGALYSAASGSFTLTQSEDRQLRSRTASMVNSSTSAAKANTVSYQVQGQLVVPAADNASSAAEVIAQMEDVLMEVVKRLDEVKSRAAIQEGEKPTNVRSAEQAKAQPPKMSACEDAFDAAEVAATHCRLISCDEGTSGASRTPTYVGPACATNKWIHRNPVPLTEAEVFANVKIGDQPNDFVFYPGLEPQARPNCRQWFLDDKKGFVSTVNQYLTQHIATTGISRRVYYNGKRMHEGRQPKVVYVYAAATTEEYQKQMTLFNLKQVKKAFGDDAFVILVEATAFEGIDAYINDVDVVLHTRVVSSDVYYDDLLLQEGILEAYKIFGKDLVGVELLVAVNDSLMGPMDLQIYDKWKAVKDPAIISMGVWRNTIATGAGMVFNRAVLEHKSFSSFWRYMRFPCGKWGSMALWEGTLHGYFTFYGASCLTSTNEIGDISRASGWQDVKLPYYKHRNKHGDKDISIYKKYQDRTVDPGQPKTITLQDCFDQSDERVEGRGLETCDLSRKRGYLVLP